MHRYGWQRICLIVIAAYLPMTSLYAEDASPGIVVWNLQANEGVKEADAILLSNFIANQVASLSGSTVISEAEIHTILKGEQARQECSADDTSCVAEIGAALGVPETVSGDIGKIGSFWMMNLRRINVRTAKVISRSSRSIEGSIDDLIRVLPKAVEELFSKTALQAAMPPGILHITTVPKGASVLLDGNMRGQTPFNESVSAGTYKLVLKLDEHKPLSKPVTVTSEETSRLSLELKRDYPMNPYKKWGYVSFFTGLGIAAFGGISTWQASSSANAVKADGNWDAEDQNSLWSGLAITGYTLGGAAIITGIVLWVLSPGDREWWEQHHAGIAPSPNGDGATLTLGGRW